MRGSGAVPLARGGTVVREGTLPGGLPYVAVGSGPPVVVLAGLDGTGGTTSSSGWFRALELRPYRRLAAHRTVYLVRRAPGIPAGCTMARLASQHAEALGQAFGGPVDVIGVSTGASIALQLALDHPGAVRRLVLLAGACRLSDGGRAVQREQARLTLEGHHRRAMAVTVPFVFSAPLVRLAVRASVLLASRPPTRRQAEDLVRTVEAEDAFDLTAELGHIGARTLVVGGGRDRYYGAELFERTAKGVPDGTLLLLPRQGHAGTTTSTRAARDIAGFLLALDAPRPGSRHDHETTVPGAARRTREITMGRRSWADLSTGQRVSGGVLATGQVALALVAWADLARRDASEVRGRKSVWAAVIAVNLVGPIAYFARGRITA